MKLKICGIKDEENAREIANLNVDYMGLIFAKSPRQVSIKEAKILSDIIHQGGKKAVGVFVDESKDFIKKAALECELDILQVHRFINESLFKELKALNLELWQVISVGESLKLSGEIYADFVLFDYKGKFKGGNGLSFEWSLLDDLSLKNAFLKPINFGLAGGIGLDNLEFALKTKSFLLDINSKIELRAGLKDICI